VCKGKARKVKNKMGDPRRQRKKYSTPRHPWEGDRIKEEALLLKDYGLKNKKELMKMGSYIKKFKEQAKRLARTRTKQAEKEKKLLLEKLAKMGLLPSDAKLDDILDLEAKDILERRLQTNVVRRGLARTMKQARQFIVHGHITVENTKVTVPSYLLKQREEGNVNFIPSSSFNNPNHPELNIKKTEKQAVKKEKDSEEEAPVLLSEEVKKEVKNKEVAK